MKFSAMLVFALATLSVSTLVLADSRSRAEVEARSRMLNEYLICVRAQADSIDTSRTLEAEATKLKQHCLEIEQRLTAASSSERDEIASTLTSMRGGAVRAKQQEALAATRTQRRISP